MTYDLNYLVLVSIFIFGYFLGSIPFGLILTKISGLGDIRKIGSGNIGATNVLRTGNKKIALFTLLLDGGKGALAIYLITIILPKVFDNNFNMIEFYQCTVAISAVVGHCFPIWLRFKGGKGVATGFGVILSLNLNIGIVALLIWVLIAKIFKISSMSALIAYFLIPILMFYYETEFIYFFSSFIISLICFVQHRENIKRLINRSEPKI
jgi:glycerol-3-phosphate acyltransferase PlsY